VNKGVSGALALILLWIAFAGFFVSFHPGGISDPMFVTKTNPKGQARNPVDVLLWLIKRATQGVPAAEQGAGAQADAGDTSTTQQPVTVT
jgi:hypothetical protein